MSKEPPLFERLGGSEAIEAVVDEFYERVLDDDQLAPYFDDVSMEELRSHQRAFISSVAGGPEEYDGQTMRDAHDHLDLTAADFDAVAGHLDDALQVFDVDERDRDAVLEAVGGLREDIVTQ